MHPCSVVEMQSHLSMCPTNMDRTGTGTVQYGMVWDDMVKVATHGMAGFAGCGLVWCSMARFG